MNAQDNLLPQLDAALLNQEGSRRADVLRRVTDLFVHGSGAFSDDQIELFDHVMGRLLENIEIAVRAELGRRLASIADAPRRVIRELAFDDALEVAAPVLTYSERLDQAALIENARTKSQGHLLAIAGRKTLAEPLTDVLIERGDRTVVAGTAKNAGARFSAGGLASLTRKSRNDVELAQCLWARADLPRQTLVRLFMEASDATRKMLEGDDPQRVAAIREAVAAAAEEVQAFARDHSSEHGRARDVVGVLHADGELDECALMAFARERSFDKTTMALSLMCDLPIGLVERCLVEGRTEQLLIIARAIDLSWDSAMALLLMQRGEGGSMSRAELDECFASYARMQQKTAQTALQFYRTRERSARSPS